MKKQKKNELTEKQKSAYQKYYNEHMVLLSMLRCALRYIQTKKPKSNEQDLEYMKLTEQFRELYHKYYKKIDKKCFKKTGRHLREL